MKNEGLAKKIFSKTLESVNPALLVRAYTKKIRSYCTMKNLDKIAVIGFGKASYQMAKAVEDSIDDEFITGGIVVTKYGHAGVKSSESGVQSLESGVGSQEPGGLKKIRVYEAAHPIPDENGIRATEEIIRFLRGTDEGTLVLCLISGGGSALFVSPCEGISLKEKQDVTDLLMKAGADITELNSVRKHLSKVKGGRLAEIAHPSEIISLMISDVVGDRLDVIASGPTAPDTSTFQNALEVIDKYKAREKAPETVIDLLSRGIEGSIPETPKKDNPVFEKVNNVIIGNNLKALEAAKSGAEDLGFNAEITSAEMTGEAKDAGKTLAEKAKIIRSNRLRSPDSAGVPVCLVSGGETTVTVRGNGKGGRNTELALSFAMEIEGIDGITLLSGGTDGNDGPTDAAGAVVDGETIKKAKDIGLNPQDYLDKNDSYSFFKQINSLLITGPTGTNVMDVQVMLIE